MQKARTVAGFTKEKPATLPSRAATTPIHRFRDRLVLGGRAIISRALRTPDRTKSPRDRTKSPLFGGLSFSLDERGLRRILDQLFAVYKSRIKNIYASTDSCWDTKCLATNLGSNIAFAS